MNKYYSVDDVIQQLKATNKRTIYRYIKHQQLAAVKIGKRYYIEEQELKRFLKEGTEKNYLSK